MRLSIAIPIYNFAGFVPLTLDSILAQERVGEVEIVVVDGASTDATPQVMQAYCAAHPQVRYVRLPQKGGIDRDMAIAFGETSGDYCWLFSGDDIMRPGALARALTEIESGCDVYLSKHREYRQPKGWTDWPILTPDEPATFDLSDPVERQKYFAAAVNTEAFFSFMGGMITRRATWDRVPYNEAFDRSCWGHVARFFELMPGGLTLRYVAETWQDRRPENDSFADQGMINRFRISIEGYHRLADTFFGAGSVEAFHVRRVIRWEFNYGMFLYGKYLCWLNPQKESRALLWRLLGQVFPNFNYEDLSTRFAHATTPVWRYRRWNREFCAAHEKARDERSQGRG